MTRYKTYITEVLQKDSNGKNTWNIWHVIKLPRPFKSRCNYQEKYISRNQIISWHVGWYRIKDCQKNLWKRKIEVNDRKLYIEIDSYHDTVQVIIESDIFGSPHLITGTSWETT